MTHGIDISYAQGTISDSKWKDIASKCNFVIIRYGYRGYGGGNIVKDVQFDNNVRACKKYNIPFGIYFYSQAINASEGKAEALQIAKSIDIKSIVYPIFCDTELANNGNGRADKISVKARSEAVRAFCDTIISLGGRTGIYANFYWLRDRLDSAVVDKYDIWCACYKKECLYKGKNLIGWQFSESNALGIQGFNKLDCNKFYKSFESSTQKETTGSTNNSSTVPSIVYRAYTSKWLGEIKNCNDTNSLGYAGIEQVAIKGLSCKSTIGKLSYRVHTKGGKWLPWVNSYNVNNWNSGVAGNKTEIDGIQLKLDGASGYNVSYRVSVLGSKSYLPWVVGTTDYAGRFGTSIDKIQIKAVKNK